ncbi:metallophosphoesterase [Erythrobacter sp. SDW2]|uniref:metallophosphoesterase n=1 Tax=Erythrobacter sp. SDW2 TaxID=2907154 RepID=UPI001F200576|nr:metallophosphoesterase [Erythrobacter sp. SDW2]UIP06120.1 metallophosphoesterase [Erythrobacter sp. SDW2]
MNLTRWLGLAALLAGLVGGKALFDTLSDPVVMQTSLGTRALPVGAQPVTIALISDIHVAGPDMPPSRLKRIVRQINRLQPDLVMIAGDLISEKRLSTHVYSAEEVVEPLGRLRAPLGTVLVPGNHDHWFDLPALEVELMQRNIRVLRNDALQIGPLAVGGLDDDFTRHGDVRKTLAAMDGLRGPRVMLSHSPDPFPDMPSDVVLFLAGHTHCGQIAYPWGGAPATMSDYGNRYACGRIDERGKVLVTSAGLGTSLVPVRLFTRPEIWLITLKPGLLAEGATARE